MNPLLHMDNYWGYQDRTNGDEKNPDQWAVAGKWGLALADHLRYRQRASLSEWESQQCE